jgi:hypothetical protein
MKELSTLGTFLCNHSYIEKSYLRKMFLYQKFSFLFIALSLNSINCIDNTLILLIYEV